MLKIPNKDTLTGHLLKARGAGPGFATVMHGERRLTDRAVELSVLTSDGLQPFELDELTWQPHRIDARYHAGELELTEERTVHDDVLLVRWTLHLAGTQSRRVRLAVVGRFEGRKAEAHPAGDETGAWLTFDISLSHRQQVVVGVQPAPATLQLAPYQDVLLPLLQSTASRTMTFRHDELVYGLRFDATLGDAQPWSLTLALGAGPVAEEAQARASEVILNAERAFAAEEVAWQHYFEREIPSFTCSDERLTDLFRYHAAVQRMNLVEVGRPPFPWPFQVPSQDRYNHLWLWDSAFHALILRWWRPDWAHGNLRTVVHQIQPSGMIPHEVYLEPGTAIDNWPDGDGQASTITQPPVLAWATWQTYLVTGDRMLLADLFPALLRYHRWWERERDFDGDGLVALVHRWEGWDTSPRWDDGFPIEPADVNAFHVAGLDALANMAEGLDRPQLAAGLRARVAELTDVFRARMWDAELGYFTDRRPLDADASVGVLTPGAAIPLAFGLATPDQAEAIVQHLTDPETLWTRFPFPSVAANHPNFAPRDYWRGPVWINVNSFVLDGLRCVGRDDLAAELLRRTVDLMTHTGVPTANEYYDPLTGDGLGAFDLGWSGLVGDWLIRHVAGVQPQPDGTIAFRPLDIGLEHFELDRLTARGQSVRVSYTRQDGYRAWIDDRSVEGWKVEG